MQTISSCSGFSGSSTIPTTPISFVRSMCTKPLATSVIAASAVRTFAAYRETQSTEAAAPASLGDRRTPRSGGPDEVVGAAPEARSPDTGDSAGSLKAGASVHRLIRLWPTGPAPALREPGPR